MLAEKGFGFISPDTGDADVFFHASEVGNADFDHLAIGQKVAFDTLESDKGLKATNVIVKQDEA